MQIIALVIVFSAKNVIYLKNISKNAFAILKKSSKKTLALFKKIMYNV